MSLSLGWTAGSLSQRVLESEACLTDKRVLLGDCGSLLNERGETIGYWMGLPKGMIRIVAECR